MRLSIGSVYILVVAVVVISGALTFFIEGSDIVRGISGIIHLLSMLTLIALTASYFSSRRR